MELGWSGAVGGRIPSLQRGARLGENPQQRLAGSRGDCAAAMRPRKYPLPTFLEGILTQAVYQRWLSRKAAAHVKRDRKRGNSAAAREAYMIAIHEAVLRSGGYDEYTGLPLSWELVSTYDNELAGIERREYKKSLGNLPTVDHVGDGLGAPNLAICSWRVNDAKHDLTRDEFLTLCRHVLAHHDVARSDPAS